ncbi:Alpha/Beta hydrolase protein [Mycena latifolia]|nr:Alpha/Beta hydrolase protein [Mycena latifolia]
MLPPILIASLQLFALFGFAGATGTQVPLAQVPAPPLHLSSLGSTAYTTLSHPRFPAHRVRVKRTEGFCDPTVSTYTGYLDVDGGAKHLFFYFFESRRDPASDDVLMWINGGPGCSSAMGLLMELGPCSIDMKNASANGTTWNPYSWNSEANIFFLDQPVGVGFSYADYGETIETTEDAAKNVHAFISIFFETFAQFKGRALHLSGESYGGRYLPVFASEIYDQNQRALAEGRAPLNLQSVIIGNGITDISTLYPGRYEVECGRAALEVPFQSIGTCVRMKAALPRCQKAMQAGCIDQFDAINCRAAVNFCDSELSTGMWASGRNVYDISKMCVGDGLCYEENSVITKYLSSPATLALLGVDAGAANFSSCSSDVGRLFNARLDKWAKPTQHYVSALLERGVRVLIYAGTYDWQCNWVANRMWVEKLEWSGAEGWASLPWGEWRASGADTKAGEVKQGEGSPLAFVTIRGAGHMVPHDKPAEALAMLSAWMHGKML